MNERDKDQKTRLQKHRQKNRDDATVYAPRPSTQSTRVKAPSTKAGSRDQKADQTRFVPPPKPKAGNKPPPAADKTRIQSKRPGQGGEVPPAPTGSGQAHSLLKNRFVLEQVLGAGGMGVVYKARDRLKVEAQDSDPYVAIKVLSEEFKTHPEAFIALQRESRKTQRIAHPNIVNVHDFDRDGDTVFMTMEFLDGKPLDKLLAQYRNTGLPGEDSFQILEGICSALMYAHAENIIHADLKPGNIFVTNRGIPKVFDFGIARAVAKAERDDSGEDKTVFDAGNLGALTPAYASLEMLQGASPDPRDDLYALGCIAYEIFTGEHPFNRVHADEALHQKLKPKRINSLSKQQWRAIEGCLAFHREDRLPSVGAFWSAFSTHKVAKLKYTLGALVLVASMAATAYQYRDVYLPQFSEQDVRSEIEQELRLELKRDSLSSLIEEARFTPSWEDEVWERYRELLQELGSPDVWLATQKSTLYQHYLDEITRLVDEGKLERADELVANAARYTDEQGRLDELDRRIKQAMARQKEQAGEREKAREAAQALAQREEQKRQEQTRVNRAFEAALANVDEQLACRQGLNMGDLEIAVEKLRELDPSRYGRAESRIVGELAECIEFVGETFPDRGESFKQHAMQIFPGSARVAGIAITPKDPCDPSLAGQGARGPRAGCRDAVSGLGTGPSLVVIPAMQGGSAYAIGRHEVSIEQYNRYCQHSGCEPLSSRHEERPATDIGIQQAQSYLDWLSEQTGYQYRLPNEREWAHAADAMGSSQDSNRNCHFESRGIQRGNRLARVGVGRQNRWGLVNHIGNAREWVVRPGGELAVAGGSYRTPMEDCHLSTRSDHSGEPDPLTGFRVLREFKSD